LRINYTR